MYDRMITATRFRWQSSQRSFYIPTRHGMGSILVNWNGLHGVVTKLIRALLAVLLCGSETWPVSANVMTDDWSSLLKQVSRGSCRAVTSVKRLDQVRNSTVMVTLKINKSYLTYPLRSRRLHFLGHLCTLYTIIAVLASAASTASRKWQDSRRRSSPICHRTAKSGINLYNVLTRLKWK